MSKLNLVDFTRALHEATVKRDVRRFAMLDQQLATFLLGVPVIAERKQLVDLRVAYREAIAVCHDMRTHLGQRLIALDNERAGSNAYTFNSQWDNI